MRTQFQFESTDLFWGLYPDKNIEEMVFDLTKIFDDNMFILTKAKGYYKEAYNKYKEEGAENWPENSIDVIYHLNMLVRMVNTLDDIIIKLTVNTFILHSDNPDWKPKKEVGKSGAFYDNHINDSKYPEKPSEANRYTRSLRNYITHDGDILLQHDFVTVEKNGVELKALLGKEGYYEHNLKKFEEVYQKVDSDIEKILEGRDKLEKLLIDKLPIKINTH